MGLLVRTPLKAWMFVSCVVCCGSSSLCDRLIACSEVTYRVCVPNYVWHRNVEIWQLGCRITRKTTLQNCWLLYLAFESLAISVRTARINSQKFYMVLALRLCVLYGSQNKQRLLSYTALADCFCITEVESVYCAVRAESLYTTDTFCLGRVKVIQSLCQFPRQWRLLDKFFK
jgi:hypothetical protein